MSPRRRKTSILDDLHEVFLHIPSWTCLPAALAVFAFINILFAAIASKNPLLKGLAADGPSLGAMAAILVLAAGGMAAVQCKHWRAFKVGVREVRELFGVMVAERAHRAIFIASGSYTREARDFAGGKPSHSLMVPRSSTWSLQSGRGRIWKWPQVPRRAVQQSHPAPFAGRPWTSRPPGAGAMPGRSSGAAPISRPAGGRDRLYDAPGLRSPRQRPSTMVWPEAAYGATPRRSS